MIVPPSTCRPLVTEMDLTLEHLGRGAAVSQLHLGGGSPTFLSDAELSQLMQAMLERFRLAPGAEVSIEVDPRTVSVERLAHLRQLGFNRLSFGVQDFDPGGTEGRASPAELRKC